MNLADNQEKASGTLPPTLVIIPARGGSKGCPGKHMRILDGIPLIAHTIMHCKSIEGAHVVVSTDSEDIAAVSRQFGADVPFLRPGEMATDTISLADAISYTIMRSEREKQVTYELIAIPFPTYPFRRKGLLEAAIHLMISRNLGSVSCSSRIAVNPKGWYNCIDGKLADSIPIRSSSSSEYVHLASSCGIIWRNQSKTNKLIREGRWETFLLDSIESIDIDTEEDFRLAESVVRGFPEWKKRYYS